MAMIAALAGLFRLLTPSEATGTMAARDGAAMRLAFFLGRQK
jgi:hypothetical protein